MRAHDDLTAVIPHYNTPKALLERAILSLDKYGISYIIVDDGSAEEYKVGLLEYGNKVIYLDHNQGQGVANKYGFLAVKTKWAMKIDSDDYLIDEPIYDNTADIHTTPTIYPCPNSFVELMNKPYAYLGGAVCLSDVYATVYDACVDPRLFEDISAMATMFGLGYTMKHHDERWHFYDVGREGSITTLSTAKQIAEVKKKIHERYELEFM